MTQQKVKPMFSKYLSQFSLGKGEGKGQYTHTRIPDSKLKISGGTYRIPEVETETFMEKYYKHVFVNGNPEFLTEKHLVENGPDHPVDVALPSHAAATESDDLHYVSLLSLQYTERRNRTSMKETPKISGFGQAAASNWFVLPNFKYFLSLSSC